MYTYLSFFHVMVVQLDACFLSYLYVMLLACHGGFMKGLFCRFGRADSEALGGLSDLPVSQDFAALAVCSSWLLQVELLRAVAHAMTVRKKGKMTRVRSSQHAVLDRLFGHTKKA